MVSSIKTSNLRDRNYISKSVENHLNIWLGNLLDILVVVKSIMETENYYFDGYVWICNR